MKKILLGMLVIAGMAVNAQSELVSKNGFPILPEAGDFAIGIDATPFLTYAGQLLGGNANTAPSFGYTANRPMMITGKYMVDETTAYRASFRLGFGTNSHSSYVQQDGQADPLVTVEDKMSTSGFNLGLGAGLEKRRGNGRLKGIYGAQALITVTTSSDSYTYGNPLTNGSATRTDFSTGTVGTVSGSVMDDSQGMRFGFGAEAFVGAEYFFAPKFSISGEFTYGLALVTQGDGSVTTQSWDGANNSVKTSTATSGGSFSFGLDTGVSGVIAINMYF